MPNVQSLSTFIHEGLPCTCVDWNMPRTLVGSCPASACAPGSSYQGVDPLSWSSRACDLSAGREYPFALACACFRGGPRPSPRTLLLTDGCLRRIGLRIFWAPLSASSTKASTIVIAGNAWGGSFRSMTCPERWLSWSKASPSDRIQDKLGLLSVKAAGKIRRKREGRRENLGFVVSDPLQPWKISLDGQSAACRARRR